MGIAKLITLATILVGMALATHELPRILHDVNLAKLYLIKESQASNWGRPFMLSISK